MRHPNRTAVGRTIRALQATGRLELADAAVIGLARATADLLDAAIADPLEPAYARAALGRLHLSTVQALTGKGGADGDAALADVIAALSTPMGYATEQPT